MGLFAATPQLDSIALINIFASQVYDQNGSHMIREDESRRGMMLIDIKRAHSHAASQRKLFVGLPPEDPKYGNEDLWG